MSEDRRLSPRLTAYLAGELDTGTERMAVAITRDINAGGLLVYSTVLLDTGAAVKIRVAFESNVLTIAGTIVRADYVPKAEMSVWRTRLAIAADKDPALSQIYAALAKK